MMEQVEAAGEAARWEENTGSVTAAVFFIDKTCTCINVSTSTGLA